VASGWLAALSTQSLLPPQHGGAEGTEEMRIPGWLATLPTQSRRFLNTEGTEGTEEMQGAPDG